jgi:hypothetical protein
MLLLLRKKLLASPTSPRSPPDLGGLLADQFRCCASCFCLDTGCLGRPFRIDLIPFCVDAANGASIAGGAGFGELGGVGGGPHGGGFFVSLGLYYPNLGE